MAAYSTWQSARERILSASSYLNMDFKFRSQDVFKKAINAVDAAKLDDLEDIEAELFLIMQRHFSKMEEYFCSVESVARRIYPKRVLSNDTKVMISSRTHRINEFYDDLLGVNATLSRELYLQPKTEPITVQASLGWCEGERKRLVYWLGRGKDLSPISGRNDLLPGHFRPVVLKPSIQPGRESLEEKVRSKLVELIQPSTPSS